MALNKFVNCYILLYDAETTILIILIYSALLIIMLHSATLISIIKTGIRQTWT